MAFLSEKIAIVTIVLFFFFFFSLILVKFLLNETLAAEQKKIQQPTGFHLVHLKYR